MIKECERPACFSHLEDGGYAYYTGADAGGDYLYVAFTPKPPTTIIHLEVVRFSHNILRMMIADWQDLKRVWMTLGIQRMIITKEGNLKDNVSYIKFLAKLGLPCPDEFLIANYRVINNG